MGFCDVALGEEKILLVHYLFQNRSHTATISDKVSTFATPRYIPVPCIAVLQVVENTISLHLQLATIFLHLQFAVQ